MFFFCKRKEFTNSLFCVQPPLAMMRELRRSLSNGGCSNIARTPSTDTACPNLASNLTTLSIGEGMVSREAAIPTPHTFRFRFFHFTRCTPVVRGEWTCFYDGHHQKKVCSQAWHAFWNRGTAGAPLPHRCLLWPKSICPMRRRHPKRRRRTEGSQHLQFVQIGGVDIHKSNQIYKENGTDHVVK